MMTHGLRQTDKLLTILHRQHDEAGAKQGPNMSRLRISTPAHLTPKLPDGRPIGTVRLAELRGIMAGLEYDLPDDATHNDLVQLYTMEVEAKELEKRMAARIPRGKVA